MAAFMDARSPSNGTKFRLRQDALAWRRVGDAVVVLDIRASIYMGVNRTGAALWSALAEGATRQQLLAVALERFDVDPVRAATDIDSLLADLAGRGLLDEAPPS
jgi:hypothetical protein